MPSHTRLQLMTEQILKGNTAFTAIQIIAVFFLIAGYAINVPVPTLIGVIYFTLFLGFLAWLYYASKGISSARRWKEEVE